jgi:hypothetical protein
MLNVVRQHGGLMVRMGVKVRVVRVTVKVRVDVRVMVRARVMMRVVVRVIKRARATRPHGGAQKFRSS